MKTIRRMLFAVKNPDTRRQPGLEKALDIAAAFGASLELFHAISTPVFLDLAPLTGTSLGELRREALQLRRQRLEAIAAGARHRGVRVSCHVAWDYPPHEAIVRRAAAISAGLIIAERHQGPRTRPWLMRLTDWELLRTSTVPVWLLSTSRKYQRPVVLAAIDPGHRHAKPAALDTRILDAARSASSALGGSLHVLHANYSPAVATVIFDPVVDAATLATGYRLMQEQGKSSFEAAIRRSNIPAARRHLVEGDPADVIPRLARKLKAGLLVMGAVSRSGLKRVFIGNTAERVLADLACDVLVVRPKQAKSKVPRKARGMKVVGAPPLMPLPV
jgi:universal stress protein E